MKNDWSAGTCLVLSGTLVAASVIGVSWCFAELTLTPLAEIAVAMLMIPPMLVLAITFAREVIRIGPGGDAVAPSLSRSAPPVVTSAPPAPLIVGVGLTNHD